MKAKIKVRVILCLILTVVTTLLQIPTEVEAHALCEACFAEKQAGGVYGYQHFYIVDLSGAVTEYVYNSKGLLVKETNPLGEVTVYTYDAFDRLVTSKTPDGTITDYTYTADGQVAEISARKVTGETEELHYRYTPEGYLAAAISEATTDEYTYTERGEVASVTRNGIYRVEFSYDEAGNLVELKELSLDGKTRESVTAYEYDTFNRMVKVVQDGELLSEYDYDNNGRLIYQADGIGNITKYVYGKENQLACMETKTAEGAVLYREENSYNKNGSITSRKISGLVPSMGGTAGEFTFCYDESDRLIKEQGIYGTILYTYDVMGNRLTKTENGVTTQYMTYNGVVLAAYNTKGERTEHYTYGNKILAWE